LSFLLFVISLLLWFGTGNQLAPLVAWLGSAMAAWAMAHEQTLAGSSLIVSALAATTLIAGVRQFRRNLEARKARLVTRNATIADWPAVATPLSGDGSLPRVGELNPEDLAALRFALDRALQPVDAFDGFDIIEQFQPSALRYQINNLGYVLSLANYTHLPAMHAWLHEAQRNLIEKKKAHRVWQYWGLENLWGNFSTNADPVARDNVMYAGFRSDVPRYTSAFDIGALSTHFEGFGLVLLEAMALFFLLLLQVTALLFLGNKCEDAVRARRVHHEYTAHLCCAAPPS
jgi:hypothetical protein